MVHAGTKLENNILLTNGGRVLCIVGKDKELKSLKSVILKNFKTLLISEDKKGLLQKFSILEQELAKVNIKCKTVSSIKK